MAIEISYEFSGLRYGTVNVFEERQKDLLNAKIMVKMINEADRIVTTIVYGCDDRYIYAYDSQNDIGIFDAYNMTRQLVTIGNALEKLVNNEKINEIEFIENLERYMTKQVVKISELL